MIPVCDPRVLVWVREDKHRSAWRILHVASDGTNLIISLFM